MDASAGVHRDMTALVARLDARTKLLRALREAQIEHGDRLNALENEVRQGFGALATGQVEITALLQRLLSDGNE
jgi:hypothetical protein